MKRDFNNPIEVEEPELVVGTASTRTKILAYLGELKPGEFVAVRKLIFDLGLRFTTAKNVLGKLEEEWIVDKRITTTRGTAASFRISPEAKTMKNNADGSTLVSPYVPPEWNEEYGKHPYNS